MWQILRKKAEMPTAGRALPGRDRRVRRAGDPLRQRQPHRAAVPGRARAGDVRAGLLLGRRAQVLAAAGRLRDRRRLRRRASRRTRPTRRSARADRPQRGRARGLRPEEDLVRGAAQGCSGRATTRRRACARATTSARSTAPASTRSRADQQRGGRGLARRCTSSELAAAGYGAITTEILDAPPFYYAEDYHQQYLAKNPDGYCGLGGTGVSCPIGLGVAAE